MEMTNFQKMALIGAVLAIIGSIGPWASVSVNSSLFASLSAEKAGIDGDGLFTLILCVGAAVTAYLSTGNKVKMGLATLILGGLSALISVYDLINVRSAIAKATGSLGSLSSSLISVNVGWGLYLTVLGSILVLAGGFLIWKNK
ncbi:MAG: hypothetical protein JXA43_03190 [Candidatus Diapherotrites archaeon]|nr:hypothetical protein [Candidatus Diapherotrites archaeon]